MANTIWKERRLEVITLSIFVLLVTTSLLIIYNSYTNYMLVEQVSINKAFMYKVLMFISSFILFISLLLLFLKRDYFFTTRDSSIEGLESLLEEIKYNSDPMKIKQFKQMLKEKNHSEIYVLISNMINELQESKKIADEASRTKSLFLSNVSHEIRTPINGIIGFSKILSSTKLDSEQSEFLDTIKRSSQDLMGIVENILDVSKIENGLLEVEHSYFNIIDEFEIISDIYALDASKKGIDFSFWIDPSLNGLVVESDSEKIKQILMNLLSNGIKFTKRDGFVTLSIKKVKQINKSVYIEFLVSDSGIGISLEKQEKIFKPFIQGDNSTTRLYGGAGLGLTISNALVDILGGELHLESVEQKGSKFYFILKMNQKELFIDEKKEALTIALHSPIDVEKRDSYLYLKEYLSTFTITPIYNLRDSKPHKVDILYLYSPDINREEIDRVIAKYRSYSQLVLVTKLDNRFKILDISPIFSQIIYLPVTYSKVKKTIDIFHRNRKIFSGESVEKLFNLKALVVEDNRVNQKLIIHTLKTLGVESDWADNGAIAVDMFKKKSYDIIFMDIQMPIMNGVIATKEILKYEQVKKVEHTPIIAVTTNSLNGDRERYLNVGMDGYISKPIDPQKFISVIREFYEISL